MQSQKTNRDNEKGAALIMTLLMSALLLTGCIALLTGASLNSANVTDAVAEQQAYNAAESGIQTAINVLRRNNTPSPLIDATKPANHTNNKIDYARAVNLETSNLPTDPSTDARLSRWINYDYTPPGAANADRASLGNGVYDPQTGSAFSVTVRDPDNPDAIIALTTSASIGIGGGSSKTFGVTSPSYIQNSAKIEYNSVSTGRVKISARQANISLGTFTITKQSSFFGGDSTPITADVPFTITVKMTEPIVAVVTLRGTIKKGTITSTSVGTVKLAFDSPVYSLLGSIITLPAAEITPSAPNANSGKTNLGVTITLSQPNRLVIRSIGYGPRGARKVFEAIVKRDNFDGLLPATITLVGSATGSLFKSSTDKTREKVIYGNSDALSNAKILPVGTISSGSGGGLLGGLLGDLLEGSPLCMGCEVSGTAADISSEETPDFLKSAADLDKLVSEYRETAKAAGRYYGSGEAPTDGYGNSNGTGITFIEGDAVLTGLGGGILVVTGKLTLGNAFDFNGTILATGKNGVDRKSGNSNGNLTGNLVVAPYKIGSTSAGFLPPKYDVTGGGVSRIVYTASNILFGSDNFNTVVVSVGEK